MSSIDSVSPIIPPVDQHEWPTAADRVLIVIHAPTQPTKAVVPRRETPPSRASGFAPHLICRMRGGGRHRRRERTWTDLLDDVLRSWPVTVRVIVLVVAFATGLTAVVVVASIVGQLVLAGLAARGKREHQQ